MLLSKIYDYLIRYYFSCRNWFKFSVYFAKLEKLTAENSLRFEAKDAAAVEMVFLIAKSLRSTFKAFDVNNYKKGLEYLFLAHKKAKFLREDDYLFYITILIDDISIRFKHKASRKVEKCISDAGEAAIRNKNEFQILTHKALKACFEFETGKIKPNEFLNPVRESYDAAKLLPRSSYFTMIQGMLIRALGILGFEEEFIKLTKDIYYSHTLESSKFSAWWKLYIYQSMKIDETRYTWKLYKNSACKISIPVIDEINFEGLSSLNMLVTQALTDYNIFSFFVYSAMFQAIILAEFFTETKGDYKRTLLFIKKLRDMEKAKSLNAQNFVDLIKTGILIMDEMNSNTEEFICTKHKSFIDESINKFIIEENGINLIDRYAILIHIAQLTNLKFIWKTAEDFYKILQQKIPDDINALLNQIKNREYAKAS